MDTATATEIVDALSDRSLPLIWEIGSNKRVLKPELGLREKALALLFACPHPVLESDLIRWVEPNSPKNFRRDFLEKAHKEKLIEFDKSTYLIHISPLGAKFVEENVPLEI